MAKNNNRNAKNDAEFSAEVAAKNAKRAARSNTNQNAADHANENSDQAGCEFLFLSLSENISMKKWLMLIKLSQAAGHRKQLVIFKAAVLV
jgi:hypothetical protein